MIVKLESFNPLSSVKDRIAISMVEEAEKRRRAQAGRDHRRGHERQHRHRPGVRRRGKGYKLHAGHAGHDVRRAPQAAAGPRRGADPHARSDGHQGSAARRRGVRGEDAGAWLSKQFDNPANPKIHRETTAQEILRDTGGKSTRSSPASARAAR